jgi:hypothetical protein
MTLSHQLTATLHGGDDIGRELVSVNAGTVGVPVISTGGAASTFMIPPSDKSY